LLASLPAARLKKIPLVFDVHTLLSSELPHYNMGLPPGLLRWIGRQLDHWLPARADHIVAVTKTIRDRLIHEIGIPEGDVTTVYTGIEMDHFVPPPGTGPVTDPSALIYTGNLEAYQGVDLMLRAFRRVLDHRPGISLKLITNSSLSPYKRLIHDLNLADHLQIIPSNYFKLPELLRSAGIALSPRVECDGLPVKILNYMATGRAIVAFEGCAETLEHGRTGLIVRNNDVEAFAAAILALLDQPAMAEKLGKAAQSDVTEFFIWEESVRLLEDIYAALAKQRA